MHLPAALPHLPLIGFEIEIEMGERVVLDRARLLAKLVELGQFRDRRLALDDEAVLDVQERALKLRIGERFVRALLEGLAAMASCQGPAHPALRGRPMAGALGHAGQHLRDVARLDAQRRSRDSLPAICMQAAEIAGEHGNRRRFGDVARLGLGDRAGDVGIFDREGAAETATHFASRPSRRGRARRRWQASGAVRHAPAARARTSRNRDR